MIRIKIFDGTVFELTVEQAYRSNLLKSILTFDTERPITIDLPFIKSSYIFGIIARYLTHGEFIPPACDWDELLIITEYLDIPSLQFIVIKNISEMIRQESIENVGELLKSIF